MLKPLRKSEYFEAYLCRPDFCGWTMLSTLETKRPFHVEQAVQNPETSSPDFPNAGNSSQGSWYKATQVIVQSFYMAPAGQSVDHKAARNHVYRRVWLPKRAGKSVLLREIHCMGGLQLR